jgi:hypothetical protein
VDETIVSNKMNAIFLWICRSFMPSFMPFGVNEGMPSRIVA